MGTQITSQTIANTGFYPSRMWLSYPATIKGGRKPMKNLKKVLSLALVFVMVFALMVSASATYSDQSKIENKEAVELITALQIMTGRNGAFDPTANVQRGEMAKMIYIAMNGVDDKAELYSTLTNPFSDVGNTVEEYWGVNYVKWANYKGVISGKSPTMFYPKDNVKGVEAAKMILVAMGFDAIVEGYQNNSNWEFNIAEDAKTYGLLEGLGYDCLKRPLTRDEAALMVANGLRSGTISYTEMVLPTGEKIKVANDFDASKPLTSEVFKLKEDTVTLEKTATFGMDGFSAPAKKDAGTELETITVSGSVIGTDTKLLGSADAKLVGHEMKLYYKDVTAVDGVSKQVYGLFETGNTVVKATLDTDTTTYKTVVPDAEGIYINGAKVTGTNMDDYTPKDGETVAYLGTEATSGKVTTFTVDTILVTKVALGTATITKNGITEDGVKYDKIAVAVADATAADKVPFEISGSKVADVVGAADIASNDLVLVSSVYDGANYQYSVSKVSSIDGYVSAVSTNSKGSTYTIGGTKYTVSNMTGMQNTINTDHLNVQNKVNYRFFIVDGKIVATKTIDGAVATKNYMLVFNYSDNVAANDDVLGSEGAKNAKVYALTQDGKLATYEIAGLANGAEIKTSGQVKTYIESGKAGALTASSGTTLDNPAVIPYELTNDGKLVVGTASDLEAEKDISAAYNKGSVIQIDGNNIRVEDNTVFFIKTGTAGTAADYSVYTKSNVPALSQNSADKDKAQWLVGADGKLAVVFVNDNPKPATVTSNEALAYALAKHTESGIGDSGTAVTSYFVTVFDGTEVRDLKVEDETAYNAITSMDAWYKFTTTNEVSTLTKLTLPETINNAASNEKTLNEATVTAMDDTTITFGGKTYEIAANCVIKTLDKSTQTVTDGYTFTENDTIFVVGNDKTIANATIITEIYFVK